MKSKISLKHLSPLSIAEVLQSLIDELGYEVVANEIKARVAVGSGTIAEETIRHYSVKRGSNG